MRVGVVCEGPTDFYAIRSFLGHALANQSFVVEFIPIQPDVDNTSPEGGWGNVLLWSRKNPPVARIQKYFRGGLFAGELSEQPLDAILLQLDTDILGNDLFNEFVRTHLGLSVSNPSTPAERAEEIRKVLSIAAGFTDLTQYDIDKHIAAPAVESTETWCLAAFDNRAQDFELLKADELRNAFMSALESCEGRAPKANYSTVDKSTNRRRQFCETHAVGSHRVLKGCERFKETHDHLLTLCRLRSSRA